MRWPQLPFFWGKAELSDKYLVGFNYWLYEGAMEIKEDTQKPPTIQPHCNMQWHQITKQHLDNSSWISKSTCPCGTSKQQNASHEHEAYKGRHHRSEKMCESHKRGGTCIEWSNASFWNVALLMLPSCWVPHKLRNDGQKRCNLRQLPKYTDCGRSSLSPIGTNHRW